jgi:hypothetical protein
MQAVAQACSREECVQTLGGTIEAVGQEASDPIRRLLLGRGALERLIRLGQGCRTGLLSVPQMPDGTAGDNRGPRHVVGETTTVLFIGQEIGWERQPTPGQYHHDALVAEGADQAIKGHRREMTDGRTPLQTQSTMRRQQGVAGDLRTHLARAQDQVGQDGEHHLAPGPLETPDDDPTQADTDIMGVARQAPATPTSHLMCELNAKRQDEGKDTFDNRLAVTKELDGGRFVPKIDGDGAVGASRFGCFPHVSPPSPQVSSAEETPWEEHIDISHIPSDLVVDQWALDVESSSHLDFLLPHNRGTSFVA